MEPLKFVALDQDDLEVVSTHLQDALVKVSDVHWRPPGEPAGGRRSAASTGPAAMQRPAMPRAAFGAALRPRARLQVPQRRSRRQGGGAQPAGGRIFRDKIRPRGVVTLTFSGGGMLRLEVECLEAELADLGPAWPAAKRPVHADEAARRPGLTPTPARAIDR